MDSTLRSDYDDGDGDGDELDDELQLDGSVVGPNLLFLPFQAFREYPSLLQGKRIFKEDEPVEVRIINIERTTHPIFHPHIYEIEIKHAGYYWTIRRRYAKIHNLHRRLKLHSLTMRIARKTNLDHLTSDLKPRVPKIPRRMDVFVTPEQLESRRLKLEQFFKELLNVPLWREHPETLRFLEVSELSFLGELGEKGKEMPLQKLSGRVTIPLCCSANNTFCDLCSRWKERWILVKDTYYAYMSSNSKRIGNVLLIDQDFRIEHDPRYSLRHKSVIVRNSTRDLVLKFNTQRDLDDWLKYFNYVLSTSGAQFIHAHPHGSSYPVRDDIPAKWFIDGAPYMSALADALELAQEEIFITDWWLSPEIYMKRPITEGERWRLDRILQRRAEAGVKIYVLLYREVSLALTINSYHSKAILTSRHPNIKVQRHPEHIGANVWLWSHHEKTVIIDQKIGFLGGIDLCFGRWDDHLYRLADVGPLDQENPSSQADQQKAPLEGGQDAASAHPDLVTAAELLTATAREDAPPEEVELRKDDRLRDRRSKDEISEGKWRLGQRFRPINATDEPDGGTKSFLPRSSGSIKKSVSRAPLATIREVEPGLGRLSAVVVAAAGRKDKSSLKASFSRRSVSAPSGSGQKIVRNEKELETVEEEVGYGHDRVRLSKDQVKELHEGDSPKFRRSTKLLQNALRLAKRSTVKDEDDGVAVSVERRTSEDEQPHTDADLDKMNITKSGRLWIGKDYCNEIRQGFVKGAVETPDEDQLDRHSVPRMPWHDAGAVVYEEAARDLARHFIQRWNACKVERNRRDDNYSYLVPRSYDTCAVDRRTLEGTHNCRVQILRSVCTWSAGLRLGKVEDSIHQAYIACIQAARHFIYIENQFFITLDGDKRSGVSNGIGQALFQRIKKAFEEGQKFRVYVVMPLKPGIEGEYGTDAGAAVQAITHWNYMSICRGGRSLIERLQQIGADPKEYLSFSGMRTYGEIDGKLVTELIYVHSKLMIVDDKTAIIASANINDRSMLGTRDSEVGVLVKDLEFDDSVMDGLPYLSGKFCGRFRRRLMKICLGIWNDKNSDSIVADAVSHQLFHDLWNGRAKKNEQIYEEVFGSLPADNVSNFEKLFEWSKKQYEYQTDPIASRERLKDIEGYLCHLSLDFLKDQNLTPAFRTRESYLPSYVWT